MAENELTIFEFFEAGLLKAKGIRFLRAEPGRRVALVFDNSDGKAARLLDEHRNGGAPINSASFAAGVTAAKDLIFGARRGV